jgi:class 3 adenylate cyclase
MFMRDRGYRQCGGSDRPVEGFVWAPVVSSSPEPTATTLKEPETERRLVSVLFADLVGFTSLSESRDAEEVRDLLSRYFDTCRQLITRYGGTVEKFIGDAVMAVWERRSRRRTTSSAPFGPRSS